MMEILRTEHLSKAYGEGETKVVALEDVNLSVAKGEFLAVIGSSGSGKSTLLHIIGGVDHPTSGSIFVEGQEISKLKEENLAFYRRRKVGLIYQFYNLIPNLSIRKNILLPLLLDNKNPDGEFFEELIQRLGLKSKLDSFPNELSSGQQQRVAIARSLIYRPAIVLADEPTGNLDRKNSEEIVSLLKFSNKSYNQTIVLITHDERVALEANRVIQIEDGKIFQDRVVI